MLLWATRMTTSPGARSARVMASMPARWPSASSWMRKAWKRLGTLIEFAAPAAPTSVRLVDRPLVHRERGLVHGLAQGWVRVADAGEVVGRAVELHRHHALVHHL